VERAKAVGQNLRVQWRRSGPIQGTYANKPTWRLCKHIVNNQQHVAAGGLNACDYAAIIIDY